MLYFFYGTDNFRRQRAVEKVLEELKKDNSWESVEVDLEETKDEYKKVMEFVSQQSIFGGGKIALVYHALQPYDEWIKFLKENIFSSPFIFLFSENTPSSDFEFLLKDKRIKSEEFKELEGKELKEFIISEARVNKIELSKEAADFFFSYLSSLESGRSWAVFLELKKVSFLGKKVITKEDLENISFFPQFDKVWRLTKKILKSKILGEKLSCLEEMILAGEDYFYIFNSLSFNADGKDAEKLAKLDLAVKSGKMGIKEALLLFILEPE